MKTGILEIINEIENNSNIYKKHLVIEKNDFSYKSIYGNIVPDQSIVIIETNIYNSS